MIDGGNGETAAVAMSKHGILELSVALPDGRSARNRLLHPVTAFSCMAVAVYWKHQYDAGLRVEATLREGDCIVRASRAERLPFVAWSAAPWHLACRDQSAAAWGNRCAQSILSELLVGLATSRRIQGV
jgi:hypothetical protein